MKGVPAFAGVLVAVIAVLALVLSRLFPGAESLKAIELSALVAFVIQLVTFWVLLPPKNRPDLPGGMLLRWGAGTVVRFLSLIFYGLIATKVLGLPAGAALVSLACFYFVTMLIEPLLLKNAS